MISKSKGNVIISLHKAHINVRSVIKATRKVTLQTGKLLPPVGGRHLAHITSNLWHPRGDRQSHAMPMRSHDIVVVSARQGDGM